MTLQLGITLDKQMWKQASDPLAWTEFKSACSPTCIPLPRYCFRDTLVHRGIITEINSLFVFKPQVCSCSLCLPVSAHTLMYANISTVSASLLTGWPGCEFKKVWGHHAAQAGHSIREGSWDLKETPEVCPEPKTSGKVKVMRQGWGKPGIWASNSELGPGTVRLTSDHLTGP